MGTSSRAARQTRRVQAPRVAPAFVQVAADKFASHVSMPVGAGANAQMRDLKGWLASLVGADVLKHWVEAAGSLCFNLENAVDLQQRAVMFTRCVLRRVLDRDRSRSQSIDTTLRRQCCVDPDKSGLTFMKILMTVCAAYDFAGITSRCYEGLWLGVNYGNAQKWQMRYDYLVKCMRAVRICVKNDNASRELIRHITDRQWGAQLAKWLLHNHHKICREGIGTILTPCASQPGGQEFKALVMALSKAVVDAAPHNQGETRMLVRGFISRTRENEPLFCAALLMSFNPKLAISVVDRAIGLNVRTFKSSGGMPLEIHRELRLFDRLKNVATTSDDMAQIISAFAKVFKFNKPPLLWWPNDEEMSLIISAAKQDNAVAITVWGLLFEHMDAIGRYNSQAGKKRALGMYCKSGNLGDLFGLTHAAKLLMEKNSGVQRNPRVAEKLLWNAVKNDVRIACSVLGDLYGGVGEPEVPKNEDLAARLYEKAADKGCLFASYRLADMYDKGLGGLPQDNRKAKSLRQVAAEKEARKREQRANMAPVDPMMPIPEPDQMMVDAEVDFTQRVPDSSAYLASKMMAKPAQVSARGLRRHQEMEIFDSQYASSPTDEAEAYTPVNYGGMSFDCSVKRRRTGVNQTLEIWR